MLWPSVASQILALHAAHRARLAAFYKTQVGIRFFEHTRTQVGIRRFYTPVPSITDPLKARCDCTHVPFASARKMASFSTPRRYVAEKRRFLE